MPFCSSRKAYMCVTCCKFFNYNNINNNNNNNNFFFILQNGSASTWVKAGINPCVAYKKCSITSISMNKISTTGKKSTLKLS